MWPIPCSLSFMTNFAATVPHAYNGKHNMASDAFQALRDRQAKGEPTNAMSFNDLIDTINPLQHIPGISSIYRDLTGDQISNQARIAGGALYGGPIGFVASMINSAVDLATGEDIGGHILTSLFGSDTPSADNKPTRVAENTPAPAPAPAATDAALITGSIAPNKPSPDIASSPRASKPVQPLPQLSPEAFNALIGSFADPEAARKANAALAHEVAKTTQPTATPLPPENTHVAAAQPVPASDIASKMNAGLNELEALKAAQAKSLSLNATTTGVAGAGIGSF